MSDDARATFDAVGSELATSAPVSTGQMFGMPCLKINGKAFAGLYQGAMVFKLHGAAHAGALALSGAQIFDPSGRGRAMKEWVQVPAAHAARWPGLGREALAYVAGDR